MDKFLTLTGCSFLYILSLPFLYCSRKIQIKHISPYLITYLFESWNERQQEACSSMVCAMYLRHIQYTHILFTNSCAFFLFSCKSVTDTSTPPHTHTFSYVISQIGKNIFTTHFKLKYYYVHNEITGAKIQGFLSVFQKVSGCLPQKLAVHIQPTTYVNAFFLRSNKAVAHHLWWMCLDLRGEI